MVIGPRWTDPAHGGLMTARILYCLGLSLSLAGCDAGGQQTCTVNTVADLPLLPTWRPAVEAGLNGSKVAVLIDTGGQSSIVAPSAVDRFDLPIDAARRPELLEGAGGAEAAPIATIHHLDLGNGQARDLNLPVATSLKGSVGGLPLLGLFGADFLSNYDVDLDVPDHRFALHSLHRCGLRIQPFDGPSFAVPFRLVDTAVIVDLKINGVAVTAQLDSGAPLTLVSESDALRIGVSREALAADRQVSHRVHDTMDEVDQRMHRFGSLEIGAERMNNFSFAVADINTGYTLLGDDFLHFNRVWISYPLGMLFIQPALRNKIVHIE